jgi:hypothetical protein
MLREATMNTSIRGVLLGTIFAAAGMLATGQASAQSMVNGTVTNNSGVSATVSSPTCQGTLSPPPGSLVNGGVYTFTATSATSTSNGCTLRIARSDNLRFCNWVLNRLRSSLTGPWNFPTINQTTSPSGVTCTDSISNVQTNGNWTATLTIAP